MSGFLITLDTILDTRMATILAFDSNLLRDNLTKYLTRTNDGIGFLSNRLFSELYKGRDSKLLKIAKPTNILHSMDEIVSEYKLAGILDGDNDVLNVYINVYPYVLDDDEKKKLKIHLLPYLRNAFDIIIIDEKHYDLKWLSSKIDLWVDYDGLEEVSKILTMYPNTDVNLFNTMLYIPRFFKSSQVPPNDKDFNEAHEKLNTFMSVEFIDLMFFCYSGKKRELQED